MIFDNKIVVITGGTGSLGKILVKRLLSGEKGIPKKIIIFSRDEAKQHYMRVEYQNLRSKDEWLYNNFNNILEFRIGDVRNYHSVLSVLKNADIVINAAALKQVPSCEYFPFEAVETNIGGAENICKAIKENNLSIDTVVGVSTDKAVKPTNVMGMTKSIQERIFISSNLFSDKTRFICVRYGNVLASRGSVIPLFHEQLEVGRDITVTTSDMTRFLLPLEKAVDTIFYAIENANRGETVIPKIKSALITDIAKILIDASGKNVNMVITGIRPGEKIHEIMVSDEEAGFTHELGNYLIIQSILPEINYKKPDINYLNKEYSSGSNLMTFEETKELLEKYNLLYTQDKKTEFLR